MSTLKVRSGMITGGTLQNYDLANVTIATEGGPSTATPFVGGQLFIAYDISLRKPRLPYAPTSSTTFYFDSANGTNILSGVPQWGADSNLPMTIQEGYTFAPLYYGGLAANQMAIMHPGCYDVVVECNATVGTYGATAYSITGGSNLVLDAINTAHDTTCSIQRLIATVLAAAQLATLANNAITFTCPAGATTQNVKFTLLKRPSYNAARTPIYPVS
jgi:hypothetical protein